MASIIIQFGPTLISRAFDEILNDVCCHDWLFSRINGRRLQRTTALVH